MLQRRANAAAAAINISPSENWRGNNGRWSTMPVRLGTGEATQNVELLVSTASTFPIAIDPAGCPAALGQGCTGARGYTYDPSKSKTWKFNDTYSLGIEDAIDLDSSAKVGTENVAWGFPASPSATQNVSQTVLGYIQDQRYWVGILGLNPRPTNISNFNIREESFLSTLKSLGNIPSTSWAYGEGAYYRGSSFFTQLTLGGYDASQMQGSGISLPMQPATERDLVVGIQSITAPNVTGSGTFQALADGQPPVQAFVDSTFPWLYLPTSACMIIEKAFGLTWDNANSLYFVSDQAHTRLLNANPSVTFMLGLNGTRGSPGPTLNITLPYGAFDLNATYGITENITDPSFNQRYFPLRRADQEIQYTLGRAFLQEAYLVADYERNNFTIAPRVFSALNTTPNLISIKPVDNGSSNGSTGSGLGGGAIAGIVVGVIGAVAIGAIALFVFISKKRKADEATKRSELEATAGGQPSPAPDPYTETFAKAELDAGVGVDYFAKEKARFSPEAPDEACFELPADSAVAEMSTPPVAHEMYSPQMGHAAAEMPAAEVASAEMPSPPLIQISSPITEASEESTATQLRQTRVTGEDLGGTHTSR